MGNKPVKQQQEKGKEGIPMLKIISPLDPALVYWLRRDIARIEGFTPTHHPAIKPPDHYIEFMRLYGWLDLDLNDPDLAHFFK